MSSVLDPRMTGRYICRKSTNVTLNQLGIIAVSDRIFKAITKDGFGRNSWEKNDLNPRGKTDQHMINWVFFVDTLNFSFWPDEGAVKFGVKDHTGKLQTGYWSLCAAVNRALEDGIPIIEPEFMASMTLEQLEMVLRSDTEGTIPLLVERLEAINQAGKCIMEKFSGSFTNCVMRSEKNVSTLLDIIVDNFESYRDMCQYKNKNVSFLKRAQVLISHIWACMDGKGLGEFTNIETLTMFADYRVPQALVALNVLEYSDGLKDRLKRREPMIPGDETESEIRGASIYACDEIVVRVADMAREEGEDVEVNATLVDFFLWDWARDNRSLVDSLPFHRCRSIYY